MMETGYQHAKVDQNTLETEQQCPDNHPKHLNIIRVTLSQVYSVHN